MMSQSKVEKETYFYFTKKINGVMELSFVREKHRRQLLHYQNFRKHATNIDIISNSTD